MTIEEVKAGFPVRVRDKITPEIYEEIMADENITEKIVSLSHLIGRTKHTPKQYINAVKFVSAIVTGSNKVTAFKATFPEKCARYKCESTLLSSASIYYGSDIVQSVLRQMALQDHVMYLPDKFKAYQVFLDGMESNNERIRMESADKFLYHLKASEPDELSIDMGIEVKSKAIDELNARLSQVAVGLEKQLDDGVIDIDMVQE